MRPALLSNAASCVAVVVATTTLACVPTDYLGLDPSAERPHPTAADAGGTVVEIEFVIEAGAPVGFDGGDSTCVPPEGRVPYEQAAPRANACTSSELDAYASCFAAADKGDFPAPLSECLAKIDAVSAECRTCVLTPASAPLWGPLVEYEGGIVRPNVGGCIERTVLSAASCGAPASALEQCVHVRTCACSPTARCRAEAAQEACAEEVYALDQCVAPALKNDTAREMYQSCATKADATYWRRQLFIFCGK